MVNVVNSLFILSVADGQGTVGHMCKLLLTWASSERVCADELFYCIFYSHPWKDTLTVQLWDRWMVDRCFPGSTPEMHCPSFVGPTVFDRTQIEFHCDVTTNETDDGARFQVQFTFDCQEDPAVPAIIVNVTHPRATLHERYLAGRLNKVVGLSSLNDVAQSNTALMIQWRFQEFAKRGPVPPLPFFALFLPFSSPAFLFSLPPP